MYGIFAHTNARRERCVLAIIVTYLKSNKENVKVRAVGGTLELLSLLVSISKCLAGRISKEKGVSLEAAENIVVDCVKDGMKTIN